MKTFKEFIVEAENLLELSPMTKQIYLRKAATAKQAHLQRAKEHENIADVFSFSPSTVTGAKRNAGSERYKALKRQRGIDRVKSRMKEEVEQMDELSKKTLGSYVKKAVDSVAKNSSTKGISRAKSNFYGAGTPGDPYGANWRDSHDNRADSLQDKVWKRKRKISQAVDKITKEEMEQMDEVITKKTPTGKVISDFVHSKNPKFAGKSKRERIRMALGAKYAMMKNEHAEQIDERNIENRRKKDAAALKLSPRGDDVAAGRQIQKGGKYITSTRDSLASTNKMKTARSEKVKNAFVKKVKAQEAEKAARADQPGHGAAQSYKQGRYSGD